MAVDTPAPERAADPTPEALKAAEYWLGTPTGRPGQTYGEYLDRERESLARALDDFAKAEREACAEIADEAAKVDACMPTDRITRASRAGSIGAAIRRRGEQP